jgi:hypothetical protein
MARAGDMVRRAFVKMADNGKIAPNPELIIQSLIRRMDDEVELGNGGIVGFNKELQTLDYPLYLHKQIYGSHKMNQRCIYTGPLGAGKSAAVLSTAYQVACFNSMADHHGEPEHWQQYFDPYEDMAVISPETMVEVMKRAGRAKQKHKILVLDDVGAGWSNRTWSSKSNAFLNNILILMRTKENVLLTSIASDKFTDVQARSLYNVYVEMRRNIDLFRYGLSSGKLFFSTLHPRQKYTPVFHEFPKSRFAIYDSIVFTLPPKQLIREYDKIREDEMAKVIDTKYDAMFEGGKKKEHVDNTKEQILAYMQEHPVPTGRKEQVAYRKALGKELNIPNDNYIYRIISGRQ